MSAASLISPLISAVTASGLGGVWLGSWTTTKRERERRKADFLRRQLTEFYGPMLGLRTAIKAHSELRGKLQTQYDATRRERENDAREGGGSSAVNSLRRTPLEQRSEAMISEQDREIRELISRLYEKMVEVFRDNISLAELETRAYFSKLIEYVEVWKHYLQGRLYVQTPQDFGHGEASLNSFYDNIEKVHDKVRGALAGGE